MKLVTAIKTVCAALIVLATFSSQAQNGDASTASHASDKQAAKAAKSLDRALAKKVRTALARTKGISVINISVRAREGAVMLQGSVPEQSQIDRATQVAQGVDGVKSVQNALTIRPLGQ
ncbi:transport-associated protein [Caballeronia temeraria]|uniref:Transport-associated protein n=1 Tax=Caballeronia temeraria TaxID=1777137 RepID=A0A158DLW5_9BURK|nr:BON domain-containing protein [Caballeronia temeraria]SAK94757.1 transport-associated protein [Caballeronia temeraria]